MMPGSELTFLGHFLSRLANCLSDDINIRDTLEHIVGHLSIMLCFSSNFGATADLYNTST